MNETSAAPTMSVLAELVLIAMRENLPAPKYMTVSDNGAFRQIGLTLNTRADLDAWNAAFGSVHVTECPPTAEDRDVLVSTMHGGRLLGWTVNLIAHVPLPMSSEVLAALGEAARSDAVAVVVPAEPPAVEGKDWVAPAVVTDWSQYGWCACRAAPGEACVQKGKERERPHIQRPMVARPLVVVQPDAEAVQQHGIGSADKGSDGLYRRCLCGEEFTGRDLADLAEQIMAHERRVQS